MSVPFVTRAEWGAKPPTGKQPWAWGDVLGIAVHWPGESATPDDHARCAAEVRGEQANQMNSRGYRDIAYNALICKHGYVFEGRWLNDESGANGTTAGNQTYFAVTFLVGIGEQPSQAMYEAFAWVRSVVLGKQPHATDVQPHSHFVQDQCPGDPLRAAIAAGTLTEDQMSDADKQWFVKCFTELLAAALWGLNPVGTADPLALPDSGSWKTAVANDNVKAQADRIVAAIQASAGGAGGSVDYAALAKAVADELHNRLTA